jgi:hypothetical protein
MKKYIEKKIKLARCPIKMEKKKTKNSQLISSSKF